MSFQLGVWFGSLLIAGILPAAFIWTRKPWAIAVGLILGTLFIASSLMSAGGGANPGHLAAALLIVGSFIRARRPVSEAGTEVALGKGLNGWQRLFVVFAVIVLSLAGIVVSIERPAEDPEHRGYAYSCSLAGDNPTPAEAAEMLREGMIPPERTYAPEGTNPIAETDCRQQLSAIANGTFYSKKVADWEEASVWTFLAVFAALGVVYVLGAALGWVWRGFFPKKPTSSSTNH